MRCVGLVGTRRPRLTRRTYNSAVVANATTQKARSGQDDANASVANSATNKSTGETSAMPKMTSQLSPGSFCSKLQALQRNDAPGLEVIPMYQLIAFLQLQHLYIGSNNQNKGPPQRMIHLNVEVPRRSLLIA